MNVAARLHERIGLVGFKSASFSTATTAASSQPIDMSTASELLATLLIGALTGTVNVAFQAATSTVASDFAAFASALQATGITASDVAQQVSLQASDVPAGKRYVRALITGTFSSTNTGQVAVIVTADSRYEPGANVSGVQTVVNS